ncbi:MAG: phosphoadenosine phosphosulfate reductase family protein [Clostridia bacterium]|nr:phosphoadenosine phosphosulfate reductase family protein [Clostridia bacterium]
MKRDLWQLRSMQAAPLSVKVLLTKDRIRDWVNEYGEDGVYVSFSGGKDSTVLLTIAREMYPNIKAVFVDTGLEYPEIREFVKTWDNVEWIKPKLSFKQVIEKYGYPFIGKEVAERVYYAQKYLTWMREQNTFDRPTDRPTDCVRRDLPFVHAGKRELQEGEQDRGDHPL